MISRQKILLASIGYSSGINNVDSPTSLSYEMQATDMGQRAVYPLQVAENVWIDNSRHLRSRSFGQTLRVAGDFHSGWSDGGALFLYVAGDTLYSLSRYYTATALVTGLVLKKRMSYASFNDRAYYSNGVNIGYIKNGAAYAIASPALDFKLPLPAGKFIAHYRGRLYSAVGKVLYISDPLSDCYDIRSGFRQFDSPITMVRPVENGVFVADSRTWFLKGLAPEEFSRELVEDNPVIPYTDVNIDELREGTKGGLWAIWTSKRGICIGDENGNVIDRTSDRFVMAEHVQGTAMIKNQNGVAQYINSMR